MNKLRRRTFTYTRGFEKTTRQPRSDPRLRTRRRLERAAASCAPLSQVNQFNVKPCKAPDIGAPSRHKSPRLFVVYFEVVPFLDVARIEPTLFWRRRRQ